MQRAYVGKNKFINTGMIDIASACAPLDVTCDDQRWVVHHLLNLHNQTAAGSSDIPGQCQAASVQHMSTECDVRFCTT